MVRRITSAGMGFLGGPPDVPDGRKLAFAWNPALVAPVGDLVNIKTHRAFWGRRNGVSGKRRMGNRYQLGQRFRHLETGAVVWHFAGHVVPSVNLNVAEVREDNRRTAEVYGNHGGPLVGIKDWNFDLTTGIGKDLAPEFRRLFDGYTITCGNPHTPTWPPREIDWAVIRETETLRVVGKDIRAIPGREAGGQAGHKFVVVRAEVRG
jgi:hypothetical protein